MGRPNTSYCLFNDECFVKDDYSLLEEERVEKGYVPRQGQAELSHHRDYCFLLNLEYRWMLGSN